MEQRIKHIVSIMVIGFFGFLAFACDDDTELDGPANCNTEPLLILREPINPVDLVFNYGLTLLDKETNEPVSGLYVKAHWNAAICQYSPNCPLYCVMWLQIIEGQSAEHITDANGKIIGQTFSYGFGDKQDRVVVAFDVEDSKGVYVAKRISFKYDYTTTSKSYTAYLLKNSAL